jgi:polygalacturonase
MGPASAPVLDARQFGARGDGAAKDTVALQAAIDSAAQRGGGTVWLSAGRYLSGTLHLKSHVTLYLDSGATLAASPDRGDFDAYEKLPYDPQSDNETADFNLGLLTGKDLEDVSIVGPGVIDGNRDHRGDRKEKGEPKPIALKRCRKVIIRDVTVKNAPNYAVSFLGCDGVVIDGVTVDNSYSDGIDPDCSRNVRISNCFVDCYDDGICLKASLALGVPQTTENVTVTNCVVSSASNQFKLGTESNGGFKNIALSNCAFYARTKGTPARRDRGGIDIATVNGGAIDGVVINNVTMRDMICPIFVRLGDEAKGNPATRPGTLRNVSISNIVSTGSTFTASITGLPGHPVEGVTLDNIQLTVRGGVRQPGNLDVPEEPAHYPESEMFGTLPTYGLYCRHITGLTLRGLRVGWQEEDVRPAIIADDVRGIEADGIRIETASSDQPLLWLHQTADVFLRGCSCPGAAKRFLRVSGAQTGAVRLSGNNVGATAQAVERMPEVPTTSVMAADGAR